MSYPPIADATALGVRLGRTLTGTDLARAEAILGDVSAMARKLSGDSGRWVDTDAEPDVADAPDDVIAVVLAAARRLFLNPDGFASEQDGDYSYRIDSDSLPTGGGMFTTAESDVLSSYADTSELWSLKTTGSLDTTKPSGNLLADVWDATF